MFRSDSLTTHYKGMHKVISDSLITHLKETLKVTSNFEPKESLEPI